METSDSKTIEQVWPKMALSKMLQAREQCKQECAEHGQYSAIKTPIGTWTGCPKCYEAEFQRKVEEQRAKEAKEWKERRASQLLGRAAIPPRFAERRLDNYAPQCPEAVRALEISRAYANDFESAKETGASLIFCGGVGTGKTHLAIGIAHEVLARDFSAVFTSVMGAVRTVKETYSKNAEETERKAIKNLVSPDLLILDEVGVQFGSDTEKLILFEIINGRYEEMKPTIIISNLAKDALAGFIGERAFDRLREGGGKLVVFDWPSYRRQA